MIEKVFTIPGAVKSVNFDSGTVEAIVSVTGNLDLQNDVIEPGAYAKALASGRLPKVVKQHDWKTWLGKTTDADELKPGSPVLPDLLRARGFGGVYVKGEFTMEDPVAAAVHAHLKRGVIDEFSVGFDIDKDDEGKSAEATDDEGVRRIKTIFPWYEWSPVLMGANPATFPIAVKEAVHEAEEEYDWENKAKKKPRFSMANGSYPINNCSDVSDAWKLRGRSGSYSSGQVARHVRRAARALGCNGPWNAGGKNSAAAERPSNDALLVPETRLITVVGASVAAALRSRRSHM